MDRFELRYADYSLSSDQEAVRDAFGEFFTKECPTECVRAAEPLGYDEKLWRQLADMGAASMGLAESAGGDGAELTGAIDYAHRFAQGTATYGGTVEVFHGIIAQHVLGLPRPSYPGSKVLVGHKRDQAAA